MNIQELSRRYQVRELTESDIDDVFALCVRNPQYYEYCPPAISKESIQSDMKALPPNTTDEQKHYIGFYENNNLVAVMDLIECFPNDETAFIGFFMMNAELQGRGIGKQIIQELVEELRKEYFYIRLGYVKGNVQAEQFWLKNRFEKTGVESKTDDYIIVVMQKRIADNHYIK